MPANHTPDIGCYLPSEEEIERLKAELKATGLAKKRDENPTPVYREPVVHGMYSRRVIRKGLK